MSPWSDFFLGSIAVATAIMALVQVGAVVAALRLAGRVNRLVSQIEAEIKPMLDRIHAVSEDAAHAVSLAAAQVDRLDRLIADVASRVEQTVAVVHQTIVTPARQGLAIASAIRAALAAFRFMRPGPGSRLEDEDALFIG